MYKKIVGIFILLILTIGFNISYGIDIQGEKNIGGNKGKQQLQGNYNATQGEIDKMIKEKVNSAGNIDALTLMCKIDSKYKCYKSDQNEDGIMDLTIAYGPYITHNSRSENGIVNYKVYFVDGRFFENKDKSYVSSIIASDEARRRGPYFNSISIDNKLFFDFTTRYYSSFRKQLIFCANKSCVKGRNLEVLNIDGNILGSNGSLFKYVKKGDKVFLLNKNDGKIYIFSSSNTLIVKKTYRIYSIHYFKGRNPLYIIDKNNIAYQEILNYIQYPNNPTFRSDRDKGVGNIVFADYVVGNRYWVLAIADKQPYKKVSYWDSGIGTDFIKMIIIDTKTQKIYFKKFDLGQYYVIRGGSKGRLRELSNLFAYTVLYTSNGNIYLNLDNKYKLYIPDFEDKSLPNKIIYYTYRYSINTPNYVRGVARGMFTTPSARLGNYYYYLYDYKAKDWYREDYRIDSVYLDVSKNDTIINHPIFRDVSLYEYVGIQQVDNIVMLTMSEDNVSKTHIGVLNNGVVKWYTIPYIIGKNDIKYNDNNIVLLQKYIALKHYNGEWTRREHAYYNYLITPYGTFTFYTWRGDIVLTNTSYGNIIFTRGNLKVWGEVYHYSNWKNKDKITIYASHNKYVLSLNDAYKKFGYKILGHKMFKGDFNQNGIEDYMILNPSERAIFFIENNNVKNVMESNRIKYYVCHYGNERYDEILLPSIFSASSVYNNNGLQSIYERWSDERWAKYHSIASIVYFYDANKNIFYAINDNSHTYYRFIMMPRVGKPIVGYNKCKEFYEGVGRYVFSSADDKILY